MAEETTQRGYPLPNPDNIAREDAARIRTAIGQISDDITELEERNVIASETAPGSVQLATEAEATAGTAANRVPVVARVAAMIATAVAAVQQALAGLAQDIATLSQSVTTRLDGKVAISSIGTGPDNIVQLDHDGKLPAIDGSALKNLVRYDAAQDLTAAQMLQARTNVGAFERKVTTIALSGGSGTVSPSAGVVAWFIRVQGAGGGGGGGADSGGGSGYGGAGGTTQFGGIACSGGHGGAGAGGGLVSGGGAAGGDINISGGNGRNSSGAGAGSIGNPQGADGASSIFGMGGLGGWPNQGGFSPNCAGAGGGGGGGFSQGGYGGGGGGAGGYAEKWIMNPVAAGYVIGAGGAGGGASGGSAQAGAPGGNGCIIIEEYYG
ncbi:MULTISPECIES: hypothetical protein [unclassified Bradyrhizobium]|uniref:hypothetical protein n=1 Tax=unclassified Bradyrhizobium TaxID=2631580 RepID=UPI002916D583|nr:MULTISPECIES: hypothetical protein [unclassified Bradyrhizobium]